MGLFDRFNKANETDDACVKPKKAGGHGSHWSVVAGSEDETVSLVFSAIEKPIFVDSLKLGSSDVNVYYSIGDHLRICTISGGNRVGEVYTAYPFIVDGINHEIELMEIDEWANGLEAQINCKLGPASISFFDTTYLRNKSAYEAGEKYTFSLSALAYKLFKSTPKTIKTNDGKELSTKGMAGIFPFKNGDTDDYLFSSVVKEVVELKFDDKDFFMVTAPLFRMDSGTGMKDADTHIYVLKSLTNRYSPAVGDDISGIIWLQGYKR